MKPLFFALGALVATPAFAHHGDIPHHASVDPTGLLVGILVITLAVVGKWVQSRKA